MTNFITIFALVSFIVAAAAFMTAAISTIAYLLKVHSLLVHLRIHFPRAWQAIGSPHLFSNNSFLVNQNLAAVLQSNVNEEISDQAVAEMLKKAKQLNSISSISFTLSLTCTLVYSLLSIHSQS